MKYIVFEGIDGAGKSSTITRVIDKLVIEDKLSVNLLKEPSDFARAILKEDFHTEEAKALLFTYDRCFSTTDFLKQFSKFDLVIGDRSYLSTIAYQKSSGDFKACIEMATEILLTKNGAVPDAAILLDVAPSKAIERMNRDSISDEYMQDMERIRSNYLEIIGNSIIPKTTVINANNTPEYVEDQAYDFIKHVLES